ncbi:hypothetical protein K432DRAFT_471760 [Lepidopterella palustris CBS 459.81]|uniref:Uncharacterized protein n=1 Tax=Lepidopterella palustris CBS 459.81 TaxID=1314670 RepID=A0A8E2DY62_9PEZI|nr:hypothetical protein K432DRAFT_471760 [Lepidopterella palustris CBS 459.81]
MVAIQLVNRGGKQYLRSQPSKLFTTPPTSLARSLFVTKNASMISFRLPVDLHRQYAFHINVPGGNISPQSVYPENAAEYDSLGFLQLRGKNLDKPRYRAGLVLKCGLNWSVLVVFGLTFDESNGEYFGEFTVRKIREIGQIGSINDDTLVRISATKTSTTLPLRIASNSPTITVSVSPKKLLGVDIFSVEILYNGSVSN